MPFRPRELVVRAQEMAALLLNTLDRGEMVQRFLDMYAAEFRRPGRADTPGLYRQQLETIRREAILAMVSRVEGALPRRLEVRVPLRPPAKTRTRSQKGRGGKKASRSGIPRRRGWDFEIPVLDLFREEFFTALGRALEWTQEDAEEFWRDLELYESLESSARGGAVAGSARRTMRSSPAFPTGPFADRVAFLLDPSLMDQARRAAGRFQQELGSATDQVLRRVLSRPK